MFGKAALFLVLGFSTIFMIYNANMVRSTNNTVDLYSDYYQRTMANHIANTGANIACNGLFLSPNWTSNLNNTEFNGGEISVYLTNLSGDRKRVVSISEFMNMKDTVIITLQPSNFAKFAYYAAQMPGNLYYATGDTVWGPMHIQGKLNVLGSPVFYGKVTAQNGLKYGNSSTNPKFYGGYESGVNLPLPSTVPNVSSAASSGGRYISNKDLYLTFNANGTVTYREGSSGAFTTVALSTYAPNGVIYVDKGNAYIKGTVKGKITLGAGKSSGAGSGNIFFDDDIRYSTDPESPSCTDMLGLVASNDFVIRDVPATKGDFTLHATCMSLGGGLTVENYNSIPYQGAIRLTGGLIESQSQPTGVWSSSLNRVTKGYNSVFKYDTRYMLEVPPAFPSTGSYEITSWLE